MKPTQCVICKEGFTARMSAKKHTPIENQVMEIYKICFDCLEKHPVLAREHDQNLSLQGQIADLGHDRMFRLIDKINRGFKI